MDLIWKCVCLNKYDAAFICFRLNKIYSFFYSNLRQNKVIIHCCNLRLINLSFSQQSQIEQGYLLLQHPRQNSNVRQNKVILYCSSLTQNKVTLYCSNLRQNEVILDCSIPCKQSYLLLHQCQAEQSYPLLQLPRQINIFSFSAAILDNRTTQL